MPDDVGFECPCCAEDINDCACLLEAREGREEVLSDERGIVWRYGTYTYCTTHKQRVED